MPKGPPKGTFEIRRRKHEKKHGIGYGSKEQLAEESRRAQAGREIEAEMKKGQRRRAAQSRKRSSSRRTSRSTARAAK